LHQVYFPEFLPKLVLDNSLILEGKNRTGAEVEVKAGVDRDDAVRDARLAASRRRYGHKLSALRYPAAKGPKRYL
jgi:hypothetical protein